MGVALAPARPPLAKELQDAKIAAIETFLDLASFFAREAVFLVVSFAVV